MTALPSLWQFGRGRLSLVAISFYGLSLLIGPCRLLEFPLAGPLKWPCTIDTIKVSSVPCNFSITCSTCNSDWARVSLAWVLVGLTFFDPVSSRNNLALWLNTSILLVNYHWLKVRYLGAVELCNQTCDWTSQNYLHTEYLVLNFVPWSYCSTN